MTLCRVGAILLMMVWGTGVCKAMEGQASSSSIPAIVGYDPRSGG